MRTITFPKITRADWEELKTNIFHDSGHLLKGDEGESSMKGHSYSYDYFEDQELLTIVEQDNLNDISRVPEPLG